jgi:hypothetical protein
MVHATKWRVMTALAIMAATAVWPRAEAQQPVAAAANPANPPSSYADVADLAVDSTTILDARIRRSTPVPPAQAIGIPPHLVRLYVEADLNSVLYGRDPVARRIGYLVDQPRLANGRAPRLNRQRVLLFARGVTTANRIQLINPGAQLLWDAGREATARTIVAELAGGSAPPRITGISQAFHVPGTVAGESETQIFLSTTGGEPVSLSILRRPGEQPVWAVAFGEIVDESARIPSRRTLGWYRLACGLPPSLPAPSLTSLSASETRMAAQDYAVVLRSLGPCDRTPPPVPVAAPQG